MESVVLNIAAVDGMATVMVSVKVIFSFGQERRYSVGALRRMERRGCQPQMVARRPISYGLGL
jgi:hypothetical protein